MKLIARPIDRWPGQLTARREGTPFTATWSDTVNLLEREVEHLAGPNAEVVMQVAIGERDCRLDGWIRADARPSHPGVIVSFESKHGPLRYHTDRFEGAGYGRYLPGWQSNVRAIALGLEALRRVDRYGIAEAGEQYRGWQALPPGGPTEVGPAMTVETAIQVLKTGADWRGDFDPIGDPEHLAVAYRVAAKRMHPDGGGDAAMFRLITEARQLIEGHTIGGGDAHL